MIGIVTMGLVLLGHLVAHETAHAVAGRGYGMRIEEAGLGLARPQVAVRWRGIRWTISPWLVGAYVQFSEQDTEAIRTGSYRRMAWIFNAGVVANLIIALVAGAAGTLIAGHWVTGAAFTVVAALTGAFRREVAAYVIPAAGPLVLVPILWIVVKSIVHGEVTGLTGLGPLAPHHVTLSSVLGLVSVFGMALALLNALPLGGVDNGQVWDRILRDRVGHRVADRVTVSGAAVVVLMLGYSVVRDVINVFF